MDDVTAAAASKKAPSAEAGLVDEGCSGFTDFSPG